MSTKPLSNNARRTLEYLVADEGARLEENFTPDQYSTFYCGSIGDEYGPDVNRYVAAMLLRRGWIEGVDLPDSMSRYATFLRHYRITDAGRAALDADRQAGGAA